MTFFAWFLLVAQWVWALVQTCTVQFAITTWLTTTAGFEAGHGPTRALTSLGMWAAEGPNPSNSGDAQCSWRWSSKQSLSCQSSRQKKSTATQKLRSLHNGTDNHHQWGWWSLIYGWLPQGIGLARNKLGRHGQLLFACHIEYLCILCIQ